MDWVSQTQAEVHPCWRVSLRARGVLSTPCRNFLQSSLQLLPLSHGLEEQRGGRGRDVERLDLALLREGDETVTGRGNAGAQALALAAQDEHGRAAQVHIPRRLL